MKVTFACGHAVELKEAGDTPPVCSCGERQIANVVAPAPRFRGACQGPLARTEDLPAMAIAAAPSGPLTLKG
jgi:hypothetical protein